MTEIEVARSLLMSFCSVIAIAAIGLMLFSFFYGVDE